MLVTLGVVTYQMFPMWERVRKALAFLGKYSMDMFLTHTFIFPMWPFTQRIVMATHNPLVIYLTLLVMSLALAMLLGKIKEVTGFNHLVGKLRR